MNLQGNVRQRVRHIMASSRAQSISATTEISVLLAFRVQTLYSLHAPNMLAFDEKRFRPDLLDKRPVIISLPVFVNRSNFQKYAAIILRDIRNPQDYSFWPHIQFRLIRFTNIALEDLSQKSIKVVNRC